MTYLSDRQIKLLLLPINPNRVLVRDGNSYVEGYDIRAELNRVFGFGRWSEEVQDQALLCEKEVKTKKGADAWYVLYRTRLRLTVNNPDGSCLARYDGSHVGASTHPDMGEAHGNALTNSETYALRRAAINLGDQFGLSLYNKGSMDALVRWTMVRPDADAPEADTSDVPQVSAESEQATGGSDEDGAGEAFDGAQEPEHITAPRDADEAHLADEARTALAVTPDPWQAGGLSWAMTQAAALKDEKRAGELWREATAKVRAKEITRDQATELQELLNARVTDIRKFDQVIRRLDAQWADRIRDIADVDEARKVLADAAKVRDAAKGHLVREAIGVLWPGAIDEQAELVA